MELDTHKKNIYLNLKSIFGLFPDLQETLSTDEDYKIWLKYKNFQ